MSRPRQNRKYRYALYPTLLWLLLALVSTATHAASGITQMKQFLSALTTLQARFEQTVENQDSGQRTDSKGTFYLRRPNQFRWNYEQPEEQQIVADGRQIWLYDPELKQVSVQSQYKALRGTPAMLLVSGDPVENAFLIKDAGSSDGLDWVELIPRDQESQFQRILLGFSDNELRRMVMDDKFGQVSRFRFFDIRHNPTFNSTFFFFDPPEDVDLYNQ